MCYFCPCNSLKILYKTIEKKILSAFERGGGNQNTQIVKTKPCSGSFIEPKHSTKRFRCSRINCGRCCLTPASVKNWVTVADCVAFTSDQCTQPTKDRPVNGPLVRLKLGLGVKRHTDRGISWCRGCWDVNLWGLGVLLRGACHLSTQKVIRKQDLTSFIAVSFPFDCPRNG